MKRILGLAIASLLILPACDSKKEETVDLQAEIKRNLDLADSNLRNNKLDEAQKQFEWVVEREPNHVAGLTGLGRVEIERANFSAAVVPLEKAVAADPGDAGAQTGLGRALAGQEKWSDAAEHLGKAWEIDGEREQVGMEYGIALRESAQYAEATKVLEAAAELNPKLQYVYRELGKNHQLAGELDAALRTFMKAQIEWKGDQDSYAGAALVYEAQGEVTRAIDQWSAYIQQDCCSTYSSDVAQTKLAALKAQENSGTAAPEE